MTAVALFREGCQDRSGAGLSLRIRNCNVVKRAANGSSDAMLHPFRIGSRTQNDHRFRKGRPYHSLLHIVSVPKAV